ncbi:MAG: hypothetical protein V4685_16715 [Bacteroidota bacterium]
MQKSNTYRRILSATFLLLYIFIATPVQLWHNHTVSKQKKVSSKISTASVDSKVEDCKICQHTYTAYVNADSCFSITTHTVPTDKISFFEPGYDAPAILDTSNKSPPLV